MENPDPFSCCGCLVEGCIWGVCLYRNRNLKKFFKAVGYFLLFHILMFIFSQPLTFMFMLTTTYLLRTTNPDPYITFSFCLLVYIILSLLAYWKLSKFFKWSLLSSLICLILNMSLMFLPSNEPYVTPNLVVFGVSNAFSWVILGSFLLHTKCDKKSREHRY
jgi:hypothetical protein